jgi:hypothetical protein
VLFYHLFKKYQGIFKNAAPPPPPHFGWYGTTTTMVFTELENSSDKNLGTVPTIKGTWKRTGFSEVFA